MPEKTFAVMALNSYKWNYKSYSSGYVYIYIIINPFITVSWAITVESDGKRFSMQLLQVMFTG
jgi:hypothetical protein